MSRGSHIEVRQGVGFEKLADCQIELRNLSKYTLTKLDLKVHAGERLAIVGPSGSGKSVLIGCLLGLMRPDEGTVTVMGYRVHGKPVAMPGLGVAFQQPGLFDGRSIRENLSLAAGSELDRKTTCEWLARIGLSAVSPETSPATLSGGQRKRIAFVRALVRGDRLLVLDEPFSGLDPGSRQRISALLDEVLSEGSKSLVMITHDIRIALALCTRILLLDDGRLTDITPTESNNPAGLIEAVERRIAAVEGQAETQHTGTGSIQWGFSTTFVSFLTRSVPLSVLIMSLLGIVLVAQTAGIGFIDMSRYVPGVVVAGVFRELSPLVVGLLLASRIGAAVSSEIAGMSYTAQLDSMRVLGIPVVRKILFPYLAASILVFPINILLGAAAAVGAGILISPLPWSGLNISSTRFYLLAMESLSMNLALACIVKGMVMGGAVVYAAFYFAAGRVESAPQLGSAVTRAAIASAVLVVIVDIVVSWFFFT